LAGARESGGTRVPVCYSCSSMTEARPTFDDGAAYDEFMGRWSRAVGAVFLDWLAAPRKAAWLDVGCGTGAFTTLIVKTRAPARVAAVDPGPAQIAFARRQPVAKRADFRVADAQALPFSDGTFDVVASALVINFIPDRARGVAEMRRVARPYGMVGGYVWDFAAGRSASWPFNRALSGLGIELPQLPGTPESTLDGLAALFAGAGFDDIATRAIDVTVTFRDFDTCWRTQTPLMHPVGKLIAAMSKADRAALMDAVRAQVPAGPDGKIAYAARANAVMGRVPR
jgi:SAM-dependent methyltransferase